MSLPTDYNGLLRLLKKEQAEMKRLQEQLSKVKQENNSLKSKPHDPAPPANPSHPPSPAIEPPPPPSFSPPPAKDSSAELKTVSEALTMLRSNYTSMAADMEALGAKWIQTARMLNQYEVSLGASNEVAPPTGTVTWVFTDVQDSTPLWEINAQVMQSALNTHNKIMRKKIIEHRAYEIRTQGDSFVLAFQSPLDAGLFCVDVQEQLMQVQWSADLLKMHKSTSMVKDDDGNLTFNGLRIRMGIHTGVPDFCQQDETSKRMDYFGPAMNLAARVGGAGAGGQIVISGHTAKEIQESTELHKKAQIRELGIFSLKGVEHQQQLLEIVPVSLSRRSFPEIANFASENARLAADLRRMKEESEAVLGEMEKMKNALSSAQDRCAAVHNLISQIRRNNLNLDNPQALLDEIDLLIKEQTTMREMVDTTRQQTIDMQANIEGIDSAVDAFREQQARISLVTTAQLNSLLKRVESSLDKKDAQLVQTSASMSSMGSSSSGSSMNSSPSSSGSITHNSSRRNSSSDVSEIAIANHNRPNTSTSVISDKQEYVWAGIEPTNQQDMFEFSGILEDLGQLKNKLEDLIKAGDHCDILSPFNIEMAPSRTMASTLDMIHLRYRAFLQLKALRVLLTKQTEQQVIKIPVPSAKKEQLTPIPHKPKADDPIQRMKAFLAQLEKDMSLPESFQYIEGTSFHFMGKKLVLSWSGEKLGVRLGGGFQPIDTMVKQLLARKFHRTSLPVVGSSPTSNTSNNGGVSPSFSPPAISPSSHGLGEIQPSASSSSVSVAPAFLPSISPTPPLRSKTH